MRNYTFGINVLTADELADMAPQIKAFIAEVGDGQAEIQVAINANCEEVEYEEKTPAIGFAVMQAEDEYEEDEEYDEE